LVQLASLPFEEVAESTEALVDGVFFDDREIIWREMLHDESPDQGQEETGTEEAIPEKKSTGECVVLTKSKLFSVAWGSKVPSSA
jgi:hypothetical protein